GVPAAVGGAETTGAATRGARPVVAMMPKAKGDPYFISARKGADSAANALNVELLWDGPTDLDPAKQNEVVEAWITRGIMAIAAPAVPGAAEAVKQSGRTDVKVTGLSLPNMCRPYIKSGVIESIVLWNTMDLGALAVRTAEALTNGELKAGATSLDAGKLGTFEVVGDEVRLGAPFVFNKSNIDNF